MSEEEREWEELWTARRDAIARIIGPVGHEVFHALLPLNLGGSADVMMFPDHHGGVAYVTADLTGESDQPPNAFWEQYELVICLREHAPWGANLLSRLATYTLEATIDPTETMDVGPALPGPTTLSAFLFVDYGAFRLFEKSCGLLLCLGITPDELEACFAGRSEEVLRLLKESGVFPFTDLQRSSCVRGA
jgi:hypothetical protein